MSIDKQIAELLGIIHLLGDPEAYEAYVQAEMARRRQKAAARNARFAATLALTSNLQQIKIDSLEATGMRVSKLWQKRGTDRIAVMLQREQTWDPIKMKMGTKLTIVYPDGRNQVAFGKIPIHEEWI